MQTKSVRFAVVILALVLASCQRQLVESVDTLTRNTDKISLAYNKSSANFTVRCVTDWTVRTDASWLTLDPVSGPGNTIEYATVTATAEPNTGEERSAMIYLESVDGISLEIKATQAAGIFEIGEPSLAGAFRLNSAPNATIDVPYDKAQGGEEIVVKAKLSGEGAQGIEYKESKLVVPSSGKGSVSATFSGIPQKMGELIVEAEVLYKDKTVSTATLETTVFDEKTLLLLPASKFPWGGFYVEGKAGIRSVEGESATAKPDDETTSCAYNSPGTTDLFRSDMTHFIPSRGLKGYAGSKVYEHGGMVKIGTSKVGGYLTTPALDGLSGTSDICVEFDYARWDGDVNEVVIQAIDGGEIDGGVLATTGKTLIHYSIMVYGATPQTRIHWTATDLANPGTRFFLSNIVVTLAEKMKDPLPAPVGLAAEPFEKSVKLSWQPVPKASEYEVSVAEAARPSFTKVVRTSKTDIVVDELVSDTDYTATVKAVYTKDEKFNSELSEPCAFKTVFSLPDLTAPVVKVYKSERAMAIIEWTADMTELDSRMFTTELRKADGTVIRSCSGNFSQVAGLLSNRFVFCGLDANTKYKLAVKRTSTDIGKFKDSPWAVIDYTSQPATDESKYVFYEDFNDLWIGANNNNLAWGPNTTWSTNYPVQNYVNKATSEKECTTACRPEATCGNAWTSAFADPAFQYHNDYWGKWNYGQPFTQDVVDSEKAIQIMLYPGAGCVKYGSGSSNGAIILPALKSLTAPTDVVVSFDMIPYATLNATDGELVQTSETKTCSGTIYSGAGEIDGATEGVIVFDVKSPKDMGKWQNQTFSFTVKGATADTRIVIASGNTGKKIAAKNRMWLDKVTVVKK